MHERVAARFIAISLFALVIAALTGVLLRFGMIEGMPAWAENFGAVRHAHSHLMYFGWVTLALMAFIWLELPRLTGRPLPRTVNWQMGSTAVVALLAFPAFWANGYGLTQIGSADLPLGSMVSTFNGLAWFWFVALYVKQTWRLPVRPAPVRLWDGGIALMLLASCGAVGLVATVITQANNPFLQQLFLHLFLDLFAVGWFTLALLGVVWAWLGTQTGVPHQLPGAWLAVALASTFILGMSPAVVTPGLFWPAAVANLVAAALLSIHCYQLWRRRAYLGPLGVLGLGALAVMILAAVIILIPGVWSFGGSGQLRIFYLHDLLLGWISTLLVVVIERRFALAAKNSRRAVELLWGVGVVGMLVALLGLGLAPFIGISALFWLQMAAWCSVAVAAAAIVLFGVVLAQSLRAPGQQQAILVPDSIKPR